MASTNPSSVPVWGQKALFPSDRCGAGQGGEFRLHGPTCNITKAAVGEAAARGTKLLAKGFIYTNQPARPCFSPASHLTSIPLHHYLTFPLPLFYFVHVFPPQCNTMAKCEWGFLMVTLKGMWLVLVRPQVLLQASKVPAHTVDLLQGILFYVLNYFFILGRTTQVPHISLPRTAEAFGHSVPCVPLAAPGKETWTEGQYPDQEI